MGGGIGLQVFGRFQVTRPLRAHMNLQQHRRGGRAFEGEFETGPDQQRIFLGVNASA